MGTVRLWVFLVSKMETHLFISEDLFVASFVISIGEIFFKEVLNFFAKSQTFLGSMLPHPNAVSESIVQWEESLLKTRWSSLACRLSFWGLTVMLTKQNNVTLVRFSTHSFVCFSFLLLASWKVSKNTRQGNEIYIPRKRSVSKTVNLSLWHTLEYKCIQRGFIQQYVVFM